MSSATDTTALAGAREPSRTESFAVRLARVVGAGNPLVSREVLTTLRLRSVKVALVGLPLLLALLVLFVAAETRGSVGTSAEQGSTLLGVALTAALYVVGLVGAVLGAQAVASERQGKTLDLVLATGMSPWRIVAGKAAAVWVVLATLVLACLPPLGACFLVGGVSLTQLVLAAAIPLIVAAVPVAFGVSLGTVQGSSRLAVGAAVSFVGVVGPMIFTGAWLAVLYVAGVDDLDRHGPFALPAGDEGFWPLLVGGVLLPAYLVVTPTWFLLAAAVSSLQGAATDRARPLRRWLAFAGPAGALLAGAIVHARGLDEHELGVTFVGGLGLILALGALVLAAHPAPRFALRPASRLPVAGPTGNALFATVVAAISLTLGAALLAPATGLEAAAAAGVVLAFVVLLAGGGVLLASVARPPIARWSLGGLALVFVSLPLLLWLALEVLSLNGSSNGAEAANALSPIGALASLMRARSAADPVPALVGAVLWFLLGTAAWALGARRLAAAPRRR